MIQSRAEPSDLVVVGAGGHAREILALIEAQNRDQARWNVRGMLVESSHMPPADTWRGPPLLGDLDWLSETDAEACVVALAVGSPDLRSRLAADVAARGAHFATLVHPTAEVGPRVSLAEGVMVGAGSILTCDISVDRHAHINVGCTVSHDCQLAEFATLAPGVHLAGRVEVGKGANLGTGVNVSPDVRIGSWSVVGAGSVVVREVKASVTVAGVPARDLRPD